MLISVDELESLGATIRVAPDPAPPAAIEQARAEHEADGGKLLDKDASLGRWAAP